MLPQARSRAQAGSLQPSAPRFAAGHPHDAKAPRTRWHSVSGSPARGRALPLRHHLSVGELKFLLYGSEKKCFACTFSPANPICLLTAFKRLLKIPSNVLQKSICRDAAKRGIFILQLLATDKVSNSEKIDHPTKHFYFLN